MANLVFLPGQVKTANVTVDVDPAGLAMQMEVFLSPDGVTKTATSGLKNFTSTGTNQVVACAVTMPAAGAANLKVYVDVLYQGTIVASFLATDTISTLGVVVGPITWG